jgi:hypothetical protein
MIVVFAVRIKEYEMRKFLIISVLSSLLMFSVACNKSDQMEMRIKANGVTDVHGLSVTPMPVDSLQLDSLHKLKTN